MILPRGAGYSWQWRSRHPHEVADERRRARAEVHRRIDEEHRRVEEKWRRGKEESAAAAIDAARAEREKK